MNLQLLKSSVDTDAADIYPRVNAVFDTIIATVEHRGSAVNVQSFLSRMNRALKGTKITIAREITKKFGLPEDTDGEYYPAMGGYCFEPSLFKDTARIKLILCVHPNTSRLPLGLAAWEYFRYRFLKCLSHELVHRAQFRNGRKLRNALVFRPHAVPNLPKRAVREQEYLGDMDEVEAYAYDCVTEWYYLNPTMPLTLRGLKREFRMNGGRLPAMQYYYDTFLGDEQHPSVRRLFRKVKDWNDIIYPLSLELPGPPKWVRRDAVRDPKIRRAHLLL